MHNIKGVVYTLTAFIISITLLNLTKWIYVFHKFKYPLFLTGGHMVASYLVAGVMIFVLDLVPNRRRIDFKDQVLLVAPFSLMGASSIACGNMALVFLFPSFHEMLQNTTPFWTVVCSLIFAGRRYNTNAYLALIPITCGGAICALGEESNFKIMGVCISFMAAIFRALRAIVQANLMRGQEPIDSITLLFYAAPFNLGLFVIGSLANEGLAPWGEIWSVSFGGLLCIASSCCMAALYNLFAFLMVGHMGAVGSMIVGNLKTPSIIILSTVIFGNSCTMTQVLGFVVVSMGAYLYSRYGEETSKDKMKDINNNNSELSVVVGSSEFGLEGGDEDDDTGLVFAKEKPTRLE